jgi:hypothetical protein
MRSHRVSVVVGFLGLALAVPAWFREAPAEYKPSRRRRSYFWARELQARPRIASAPVPRSSSTHPRTWWTSGPVLFAGPQPPIKKVFSACGLQISRSPSLRICIRTTPWDTRTLSSPPGSWGEAAQSKCFGPPGTRAMTDHVLAAWKEDIEVRTQGLERDVPEHNDTGYKVNAHEIQPGVIYKDGNVTVTAFPVAHGEWPHAFGYRFETVDRTIVISGDTSPTDNVVRACNGCDVLIHEVYTQKAHATSPASWQKYRPKYHTSSKELPEIANRARPKLLILYHQGYGVGGLSSEEDLIKEMRAADKGDFVSGHDLDMF